MTITAQKEAIEPSSRYSTALVEMHAARIDEAWEAMRAAGQKTVEAIINLGQRLLEAKAAFGGYGDWLPLLRDKIRFGADRAERLMRIAQDPFLTNSANWPNLPPTISGLRALAGLKPDTKKKSETKTDWRITAMAEGRIWADMTVRDISALLSREKGDTKRAREWDWFREQRRLLDAVFVPIERWLAACPLDGEDYAGVKLMLYPETLLPRIAGYLREGRERRALLTQVGIDFLSETARTLDAKAGANYAMNVAQRTQGMSTTPEWVQQLFESDDNFLLKWKLRDSIKDLVGRPEATPKAVIQAIARVIEGRIPGQLERMLLERALEAQGEKEEALTESPLVESAA